jgi:hypothetical protein
MVASITLREFGLADLISRYKGSPTVLAVETNNMLRDIGRGMVPVVKRHTPTGATRRLRNGTVFTVERIGFAQRMIIRQSARSPGGAFYGEFVREGTRPHFPPIEALIPWVMAKWGLAGEAARQGAYRLALAISRRGTKANRYHDRALQESRPFIRAKVLEFKIRLAQALKRGR